MKQEGEEAWRTGWGGQRLGAGRAGGRWSDVEQGERGLPAHGQRASVSRERTRAHRTVRSRRGGERPDSLIQAALSIMCRVKG